MCSRLLNTASKGTMPAAGTKSLSVHSSLPVGSANPAPFQSASELQSLPELLHQKDVVAEWLHDAVSLSCSASTTAAAQHYNAHFSQGQAAADKAWQGPCDLLS